MKLRARVRCLAVPAVAAAALVLLPATQASAATFSAANTAQLVSAVASANAAAGADTIQLSAGASYAPTATLAITGDLTITGPSSLGAASSGAKLDGGVVAPFPSPLVTVAASVQVTLANVLVTSGGGTGGSSQPAIDDSGTLVIQNSTLSGNNGAGVLVEQGATATITNSTIANGNDIGLTDLGTATLVNSTVAFNAIGGIDNSSGGALTLTNTIVAKNLFSDCSAAASTQTRSLDGDGTCSVSVTAADPKLGAFVLDGGPTPTFPLQAGSAAINAGDNASCPATDQRFVARDASCDIGADEYNATKPTITVPASVNAPSAGASGANVTYTASASSTDDAVTSFSCAPASGTLFANGTTTVTCNAKDGHGNTQTASFPVTVSAVVVDTTPPVISVPGAPVVAEATSAAGANVAYTVSATDPDDAAGVLTLACLPASGSVFPLGNTTVTCNAHDPAGNNATPATFTVTVQDTTAPVIAAHAGITSAATSPSGAAVTYTAPNASDAVKGTFAATCTPASGSTFAVGATTVTCNASDAAGNTATPTTFTVTVTPFVVVDTTPPVISVPGAPVVAEATSAAGANVAYTVTATDPDDAAAALTLSCVPASGSVFPLGNTTVTCNAHDPAGNNATPASFTVTVSDTTAPVIAAHAGVAAVATGPSGAAVTYTAPNATDAVKGTFAATCTPASGSTFAVGATTVTCNASDAAANAATPTTFTVTVTDLPVVDTTPPVISVPGAPVVAEATSAAGANVAYTVTATDPDDAAAALTLSCVPASGSVFPLGNTTVTCNAHDPAGNNATPASFTVTVSDTTAPVIDAHGGVTAVATGPSGAAVSYTAPNASDAVKGTFAATCAPASGSTFAVGATTVTCNASDVAGNTATPTTFTVTVTDLPVVDTTPPVISVPGAPVVAEATSAAGANVSYTVSATDPDDAAAVLTLSCVPASGSVFPLGNSTVTCNASDPAGNNATPATFTVTVRDTTAPVIAGHAGVTAVATGPSGAAVTYTAPNATDAVDGTSAASCTPASGSTFAIGATTVTCNATDAAGNAATPTTFSVTVTDVPVVDTTPPVISVPGAPVVAEATSAAGANVAYTVSATDPDDAAAVLTLSCVPASGSAFPLGNTTVTCNAHDPAGNNATPATFTVTVRDTTAPVIAAHAGVTAVATGPSGAAVTYTAPNATDAVKGTFAAACTPASGATFAIGATTVTCNASDAAGNAATATTFTVTVTAATGGTPAERILDLQKQVRGSGIAIGLRFTLVGLLADARESLLDGAHSASARHRGDDAAARVCARGVTRACRRLNQFIATIALDARRRVPRIPAALATSWTAQAQSIQAQLGCTTPAVPSSV